MSPLHRFHKQRNLLHTVLLLGGMFLLLVALCNSLFGGNGLLMVVILIAMLLLFTPRASAWLTLRLYRARQLSFAEAPGLYRIVESLSQRAGVDRHPVLFYLPTATPNAFAMMERDQPLIAVTDGLLRLLNRDELAAVLAHEVSHIRNGDLQVMMIAEMIVRLTASLASTGWLMLILLLPLWLVAGVTIPFTALLLLLSAPLLSMLLQRALSRTREFDADLDAVGITGRPAALASALVKLEQTSGRWWYRMLPWPGHGGSGLLLTHPATEERVARLRDLALEQRGHLFGFPGGHPGEHFLISDRWLPHRHAGLCSKFAVMRACA